MKTTIIKIKIKNIINQIIKNKITQTIVKILLILWQLPQIILGTLLLGIVILSGKYDEAKKIDDDFVIKQTLFGGGLSLGYFIFVSSFDARLIAHELGHSKQSKYLGWLYLIVIGLPSFLWAALSICSKKVRINYYRLYTESWADKLGGVVRNIVGSKK